MTIDDADRRLLALLRENARRPVAELARALDLSRTTVQSRIARLERRGTIAGYTVRLTDDYERGLVRAQMLVTLDPKRVAAVEAALRRIPEIRTAQSVSGVYDMIVTAVAANVGELDRVIDTVGALDGVERTTSLVILSTRIER